MYSCFRLQKHKLCTCTVSLPSEVCNVIKVTLARKKIYHRLDRHMILLPSEFCLPGDPWRSPVGIATLGARLPGASPPQGFASLGIPGHPLSASPPSGLFREGGVHILDIFLSLSSFFRGRGCLSLSFPWGWVGFYSWALVNQSLAG